MQSGAGRRLGGWFGGWFAFAGLWKRRKRRKLRRRSSVATSSGRTCLLLLSDTFQQTFSEKSCLAEIVLGDNIAGGLLVTFEKEVK